jgi:hypothetical protein
VAIETIPPAEGTMTRLAALLDAVKDARTEAGLARVDVAMAATEEEHTLAVARVRPIEARLALLWAQVADACSGDRSVHASLLRAAALDAARTCMGGGA